MQIASRFVLLGMLLVPLASCSGDSSTDSDRLVIAVIPKAHGAQFWETVKEGAEAAAKEMDVDMRWEGPQNETEIAKQNKIIDNMITLGVDGIALAPLNPKSMRKPVQQAVDEGIPVVIFDSAVDGDAETSFIATDNKQGGVQGAKHLIGLLGNKPAAKVMLMGFIQGTASTDARADGFRETVQAAGLNLVADPFAEDPGVGGAKKTASNTLEGFIRGDKLELDGVFACNDRATLGMLDALEDLRKANVEVNVKFVGFDSNARLIRAVREGKIDALVVQDPRKMGYLAVKTLVEHLRKKTVRDRIDTGIEVVTKERLENEPSIRKLVGDDQ